ncbi:hypothetical protein JCM14076_04250 [Methylosoma difficile]
MVNDDVTKKEFSIFVQVLFMYILTGWGAAGKLIDKPLERIFQMVSDSL